MIEETREELKAAIDKSIEALKRELSKLRAGRANPDVLDAVRVDYYGSPTPLMQLASVSVPEPRMIFVKPFDKTQIQAIERAIQEAQLGINPSNDGDVIRLPVPSLTEERRKELVKVAKKYSEDAKISIRNARRDANSMLDALKKEGEISEDDADRAKKEVDEIVKAGTTKVDETVAKKEVDILEV